MKPDVVRIENVTKTFNVKKQKSMKERLVNARVGKAHEEKFNALEDVTFSIVAGESVGLVGPNGSGKSTLLKTVGGILAPDSGHVMVRGRIAALLELGAGFHPDLTGRENVYLNAAVLGLTKDETNRYFDDIVDFSGIPDFIDTQVKFYSSGMYVRLAFAVAVHVDPDVLLIDEVLAVGDEPFQVKCMEKIHQFQEEGRTIIFVSHSAGQVADVCDRAIVLEHGRIIEDDVPIVALGRLRRDYQETIDANREASNQSTKSPHEASVERIYLTAEDTYHHSDFQVVMKPGKDLKIHCDVTFPHRVEAWALHVSIENFLGAHFLTIDTRDTMQEALPAHEGTIHVILTLPNLELGEGEYVVNVQVKDGSDLLMDQVSHAGSFAVRSAKRSIGSVYVDPVIDVSTP